MAVEAPADISILGLNRISIEAGLYARFLGYRVSLWGDRITAQAIGSEQNEWNGVTAMTSLGRRALQAQGVDVDQIDLSNLSQFESNYLLPLAQSDLLADCCFTGCQSIRIHLGESEPPEAPDEDVEYDTRIFLLDAAAESDDVPASVTADVLIDCREAEASQTFAVNFESPLPPASRPRTGSDPDRLLTEIDDFYFLGMAGDKATRPIDLAAAWHEIRDLFRILSDNPKLDLYQS